MYFKSLFKLCECAQRSVLEWVGGALLLGGILCANKSQQISLFPCQSSVMWPLFCHVSTLLFCSYFLSLWSLIFCLVATLHLCGQTCLVATLLSCAYSLAMRPLFRFVASRHLCGQSLTSCLLISTNIFLFSYLELSR